MKISRRSAVIGGAALTAAAAIPSFGIIRSRSTSLPDVTFKLPLPIPPILDAREHSNSISLDAAPATTRFLPDKDTLTYGYQLLFHGPVIRVHKGDTVTMNVTNSLYRPTTVHWHGVMLPSELDGGPYNVIEAGKAWRPVLKIDQPASTAWYHPHLHGDTGYQVYMGLAGLLYIEDGTATALGLPTQYGIDDIPLLLQDRSFNPDGSFAYDDSPMGIMHGSRGDTIIVNGTINPVARVPKGIVRLRLLNAANARNFNLRLDDGRPFVVIATDNGFITSPAAVTELLISPGERYEALVDFSDGGQPILATYPDINSRSDSINVPERTDAASESKLSPIMKFAVDSSLPAAIRSVPRRLIDLPPPNPGRASKRRSFVLDSGMLANSLMIGGDMQNMEGMDHSNMTGSMGSTMPEMGNIRMGINGLPFDMNRVDAQVKLGDQEIWEISGTEMAHPFHIHGASFRVLKMDGAEPPAQMAGWKDTVLVNERAELLVSFNNRAEPTNPFMFHCHILEHEDAGMMAQYVCT